MEQKHIAQAPRRGDLSICNLIFCAMVLLLHLCSDTVAYAEPGTAFYIPVFCLWKLCSVAVYGFVFLAGLKGFIGRRRPIGEYYRRRVTAILLPYVVWSVLYYLFRAWLGGNAPSLGGLGQSLLLGSAAAHLYYVIAIMQFYLLMPLWRKMADKLPPVILLPVLAALSTLLPDLMARVWSRLLPQVPVYLDRFFLSYIFVWVAGCYAGANYEQFHVLLRRCRWPLRIATFSLLPLYLYFSYQNYVNLQWYGFMTSMQQYFVLLGIAAVMTYGHRGANLMRFRLLQALDRASYQIYLSHMAPLLAAPAILSRLGVTAAAPQLLLRTVIVLVPTLGGCLLWQYLRGRLEARRPCADGR